MTHLDSILKSRDIALPTKVRLVKAMYGNTIHHVWMWELDYKENWVPKNWCFWTMVLGNTLESPLDCKEIQTVHPEGNQSWIFIGRMLKLKLKLQYFGHLMWRIDSLEKTQMLGKIEGRRRGGLRRMRWLDGITDSMDRVWASSRSWWWTGKPGVLQAMVSWRVRNDWATDLNSLSIIGSRFIHFIRTNLNVFFFIAE